MKWYPLALWVLLLWPLTTHAAPKALTDSQLQEVTGQKGIVQSRNLRPSNTILQEKKAPPPLFTWRPNHPLQEEQRQARALYRMKKNTDDAVKTHLDLFEAPKAVKTVLSAPLSIGGFFF